MSTPTAFSAINTYEASSPNLDSQLTGIAPAQQVGAAPAPAPAASTSVPSSVDTSPGAKAQFINDLNAAIPGLGDLYGNTAWTSYINGENEAQILSDFRASPQYDTIFPGLKTFNQAGSGWTESQYESYRTTVQQSADAYGIPSSFITNDDIGQMLNAGVSATAFEQRAALASQAVDQLDPDDKKELAQLTNGAVTDGALTAYYLDPTKAIPVLQNLTTAAQIGGASLRTGYGNLDNSTLLGLAQQGVTQDQATAGFNKLGLESSLFTALPGSTETGIDQTTQLGAEFGQNAADQLAIQKRADQRTAAFSGGGSIVGSTTDGAVGLRTPQT